MSKKKSQNDFERRLEINRREYNYTNYFPERRSGEDRREIVNFQKLKAV